MQSAAKLTEEYIKMHASIRHCLKKGIINYSSLARLISKDLNLENKVSEEAIVVATRRYKDKSKNILLQKDVLRLFKKSNMEIKNNICIFTLDKGFLPLALVDIEKTIKKDRGVFFAIEGTKTLTIITQNEFSSSISKSFKNFIITKTSNLTLITITSKGIDETPGAIAYLTDLFFEHGINIEEFMSCHDDTLIVIDTKKVSKVLNFLNF